MFLHHVVEGLLEANYRLTLAIDLRTETARKILREKNPDLLTETSQLNTYEKSGNYRKGSEINALADVFVESGAGTTFVNSLDGFASAILRRATLGANPPAELKGRLGGIYERPRWFSEALGGFNNWLKQRGFARLSRNGWFTNILLLNEFFAKDMPRQFPDTQFGFLPTTGPRVTIPQEEARRHLDLPSDAIILLNYGVGHRRKGLHLVTQALNKINSPRLFLLCAGKQNRDSATLEETLHLEKQGRAKVLNRYITEEEEGLCFRASDFILAPYLSHFGNSNILAQAVLAGRPVLASDYDLIGRRVRERQLGILFKDQSIADLTSKLKTLSTANPSAHESYTEALDHYAQELSIESFRTALQTVFPKGHPE